MPDIADEAQFTMDMNLRAALSAAAPVIEEQERDQQGRVICSGCGEPIPAARLLAVPWAFRCVDCQEKAEGHK